MFVQKEEEICGEKSTILKTKEFEIVFIGIEAEYPHHLQGKVPYEIIVQTLKRNGRSRFDNRITNIGRHEIFIPPEQLRSLNSTKDIKIGNLVIPNQAFVSMEIIGTKAMTI
jgi:hypothetical protein